MTTWNKITKASGTSWTKIGTPGNEVIDVGGSPIGLLLALTYPARTVVISGWTKITKAAGTTWTKITKAT